MPITSLPPSLAALANYPTFCLWKPIPQPDGSVKKLPVSAETGGACDPHDPTNQLTSDEAFAAAGSLGVQVGFVFTDDDRFFFLDIDHCRQADGSWSPFATELCKYFAGAAIEVSQSGNGLHIFGYSTSTVEHSNKNTELGIELYRTKRFAALTFREISGQIRTDLTAQQEAVAQAHFPARAPSAEVEWESGPDSEWMGPSEDAELLNRMLNAQGSPAAFLGQRASVRQLWEGDVDALGRFYPSPAGDEFDRSSADAALCFHLAFWTGKDCRRIERFFSQSALGQREKWTTRPQYRRDTIEFAVGNCKDVYRAPRSSNEWPALTEFAETFGPEFPIQALPSALRDVITAVSEFAQTPLALAASALLGALAVSVQRRFWLEVKPGYSESLSQFLACALAPASRKSLVFRFFGQPIHDYARHWNELWQSAISAAAVELNAKVKRLVRLKELYAKCKDERERQALLAEQIALDQEIVLLEARRPRFLKLLAGDITPAEVANAVSRAGERLAIWTDEGSEVFALMDRFSEKSPHQEIYLKCYSGEPVDIDRASGTHIHMERPALTIVSALQPAVLEQLSRVHHFKGRGLFERFLWTLPKNTVGDRKIYNVPPVPQHTSLAYSQMIYRLLSLENPAALPLRLSPEALGLWLRFSAEIEPDLSTGAALEPIGGWVGKLAGTVARIAGLLHSAEHWENLVAAPVSAESMTAAITIGRFFLEHAHVVFGLLRGEGTDPAVLKVWRCIVRHELTDFKESELWQLVKKGHVPEMAVLKRALGELEADGYIRPVVSDQSTGRSGRPPSPTWEVNPRGLELVIR